MRYWAFPQADKGFVRTDPVTNPVRWYVDNGIKLLGPFKSQEAAEDYAREQNNAQAED